MVPELGLPGMLLWLALLVMIWRRSRQITRVPELVHEGRAMQITMIVSQFNCMFEPTFRNLQYQFLFYWIFGVYLGSISSQLSGRPRHPVALRS